MDSLEERRQDWSGCVSQVEVEVEVELVSQVEVFEMTASKPWQTPTVEFHLHGQRLLCSAHPAYRTPAPARESRARKMLGPPQVTIQLCSNPNPTSDPKPKPYCWELHWLAQTTPIEKRARQSLKFRV